MHTTRDLRGSSFAIRVDGRPAALADVLPGFGEHDRLGVVVDRPGGAIGASGLLLAAITGFYDFHRRRGGDFLVYPDYFVLHVGAPHGDHRRFDVWPPHKEVVVSRGPDSLLQAVNDRAVSRLLVPEDGPGEPADDADAGRPALDPAAVASARARIESCLAYSPGGRADRADVVVRGDAATEAYVTETIAGSDAIDDASRRTVESARRKLRANGAPAEAYRRIGLDEALGLLARACSGDENRRSAGHDRSAV